MKHIKDWLIDYLYVFRGFTNTFINSKPPQHYLEYFQPEKSPVILIPGISEKWAFLKNLGDRISLAGYPVYTVPQLNYNFSNLSSSAQIVENIIDQNQLKNIILVTHSKGGLIGKYLLVNSKYSHRIKLLIAIATPFSGSQLAKIVPHPSYKELSDTSPIIFDLLSKQTENDRIISIYPQFDNHIPNPTGCYLKGAQNIQVKVKGHTKILFDHVTQTKILDILNHI